MKESSTQKTSYTSYYHILTTSQWCFHLPIKIPNFLYWFIAVEKKNFFRNPSQQNYLKKYKIKPCYISCKWANLQLMYKYIFTESTLPQCIIHLDQLMGWAWNVQPIEPEPNGLAKTCTLNQIKRQLIKSRKK